MAPLFKTDQRRAIVTALFDELRTLLQWRVRRPDITQRWAIANALERGCFNAAIRRCRLDQQSTAWENPYFEKLYGLYARDLVGHLTDPAICIEWRRELAEKIVCSNDAQAFATSECFIPRANEATRAEIATREANLRAETRSAVGTNLYKCPKCGARNADAGMKQTRAADEGATVIVECLECGNKFRG